MTNIKFTLSPQSINKAISQLKAYKESVRNKSMLIVQNLIDLGLEVCRVKIIEIGAYDTGELLNSVSGYYSPLLNAGYITVDCNYAVFVEFGTGSVGEAEPYPGTAISKAGYHYTGGTKYVTTKDGKVGWFYPTDDGEWRFTEGMPSRPFMYETVLEMERSLQQCVREVFR